MKDKTQSLKLVCFSPTGTTKKIVQAIADGLGQRDQELISITSPDARKQYLNVTDNDLLVVGVPVYMGRVAEWLQTIKADRTPAVCVVVYGNRTYGDALLELKDILVKCGCNPIAGAAYIGEHSFSAVETPIAGGRPDAEDLNHAKLFGSEIRKKLQLILSGNHVSDMPVPGNYPYEGITELWDVDFIAVNRDCMECGVCAAACPVGAIDFADIKMIDIKKCITCCACIKNCPQNARIMKTGLVKDASIRLNRLYSVRKEPFTEIRHH